MALEKPTLKLVCPSQPQPSPRPLALCKEGRFEELLKLLSEKKAREESCKGYYDNFLLPFMVALGQLSN